MNPQGVQYQAFGLRRPLRAVVETFVGMVRQGFECGFTGAVLEAQGEASLPGQASAVARLGSVQQGSGHPGWQLGVRLPNQHYLRIL
ncbi:hypothetical protein D3C76_1175920 [compost metagenome]